jgi:hypothetical protein
MIVLDTIEMFSVYIPGAAHFEPMKLELIPPRFIEVPV